ncbi:hypothetical protein [Dielma fastidiosa]|uniref:hypothetical protein n=1 Tax=Dielma fastidiosa TaxID=1034346 RepID=UPI000E49EE2E|nr:hypothetical protein [Dielma fastidiosa]RHM97173.1 hypothetical protein DWZ33_16585 [Dielma fastidiosa]
MKSSIDFTQIHKQTYEIVEKGGKKVNILPPTISMLADIELLRKEQPLDTVVEIFGKILSHNQQHIAFNGNYVRDNYSIIDIKAVINEYNLFAAEVMSDPN